MGITCSTEVPDDISTSRPPDVLVQASSHPPWPSILLTNSCVINSKTDTAQNNFLIKGSGSEKLEEAAMPARRSLSYRLARDSSLEKEESEEKQNKRLSRVISRKAKSAKTRTRTVAKRGAVKVSQVGHLLGKAGTTSFEIAIEALDTVGSSLTTLGVSFKGGVAPKARKIGILAFEVANTVVKGFYLMQALSDDGIKILKDEVLPFEGIQRLISKNMDVLWRIAAADKRSELCIYIQEVVRFGNHCKDPRWHQLSRFFSRLEHEMVISKLATEEMEEEMNHMITLAQNTAELYHELHALDRLHNDLHRTLQHKDISIEQQGENLAFLKSDMKTQSKHVKSLKRRSFWSRILEEVMEKLVNVAFYLRQRINDEFGLHVADNLIFAGESATDDTMNMKGQTGLKLGDSGLALHYANIINQINNLASRPSSIAPSSRDALYQGLPPQIKASLRARLCCKNELTAEQIKAEMEKVLEWLLPVAINTTRAHHGFGWVGEWAMKGMVLDRKLAGNMELALIQTLHHADQAVTEAYICDLIVFLHLLVSSAKSVASQKFPNHRCSPMQALAVLAKVVDKSSIKKEEHLITSSNLPQDDEEMLQDAVKVRKRHPGMSKSQEFDTTSNFLYQTLSKSNSMSPGTSKRASSPRKQHHTQTFLSVVLDIDRINDYEKINFGKIYHS